MIRFETEVRIERPLEDVVAYVAEAENLPHWNSAVQAVHRTPERAIYTMERSLPTGPAVNTLEVAQARASRLTLRTTSGPTPFTYEFRFLPDRSATVIQLDGEADLGGAADLLAPLVSRGLRRGVDDNLATLKAILEAGPSLR
jgi:uncharacterized membrane protein